MPYYNQNWFLCLMDSDAKYHIPMPYLITKTNDSDDWQEEILETIFGSKEQVVEILYGISN